jgi:signal transduction histidine kinase
LRLTLAHSIRAQLTLLATGVVAALVMLFAGSSYLWFRGQLESELREFARHEADEVANLVAGARTQGDLEAVREGLDHLLPETGVLSLAVWSLDGRLVYQNPPGASPLSAPWPEGLAAARSHSPIFETFQPTAGLSALRTAVLVSSAGEARWVAVVSLARARIDASLASFRHASVAGLVLTTLLTLALSGILVNRALRPVQQLVRDAKVVSREGPGRRLARPPDGSELAELVELLNRMLEQTEASLERLRRFTGHASHELRTPLTRMRGELESALVEEQPEKLRDALGVVLEDMDSLRGIIDALLELAHGDEQRTLATSVTDLTSLVEELVEQARLIGLEREVRVEIEAPPQLRVCGSRALLARAIWNLIDNALRFSPRRGRLRVHVCEAPQQRVRLEVEDEGPGLGASPERLFEAFARGERQPEGAHPGHGLGLALARSIARRHGGDVVALASVGGRGARLRLELPKSQTASETGT